MSIINVMHPKTKEIIQIDTDKVQDWQHKFLHRSGVPFVTDEEVRFEKLKSLSENDLKAIVTEEDEKEPRELEEVTIEDVRGEYQRVVGNPVPNRYKNDRQWLLDKIYEAQHGDKEVQ